MSHVVKPLLYDVESSGMQKFIFVFSFVFPLLISLLSVKCKAQNYLGMQGTELFHKPQPIRIFGFLQPAYFYSTGQMNPSQNYYKNDFNLRRARIGIRGDVPGLGDNVNYLLLTGFGRNGLTQNPNGDQGNLAGLVFASVTLNYIPGVRIRVGQFRKPLGQEGLITANARNVGFRYR